MEDLRLTAKTYHEAEKKENNNDAAIKAFFNEMDLNRNKKISFHEFKSHMKTIRLEKFASDKGFFDKLKKGKECLNHDDVVTLLYIINSGRPFCQFCKLFIEGSFFTCVRCFDKKNDYYLNFCPECYYEGKNHAHRHKQFMDPVLLLLLKAKGELNLPIVRVPSLKNEVQPGDPKRRPPSPPKNKTRNQDIVKRPVSRGNKVNASDLVNILVAVSTVAAATVSLCTIM